jgi:hypothetical protein
MQQWAGPGAMLDKELVSADKKARNPLQFR